MNKYLTKWEWFGMLVIVIGFVVWQEVYIPSVWAQVAAVIVLITAVIGAWRAIRERQRDAELPPQEVLLRKAQMRGRSEMAPLLMYFAAIPVVNIYTSAAWAMLAAIAVAGLWLFALHWHYSRNPLVPPQPKPSSTTA